MEGYPLFAIKTNRGYGLIQRYERLNSLMSHFCIVYCQQIKELNETEILSAMKNEYYYYRICTLEYNIKSRKEEVPAGWSYQDSKDCLVMYLSKYPLPEGASIPTISRKVSISFYTGKYSWYLIDEKTNMCCEKNGKAISYKRLTPEIAAYPDYYGCTFDKFVERFNMDFRNEDYNDDWIKNRVLEQFYIRNPHFRPSQISYEEAQKTYPIEEWKENTEGVEDVAGYLAFCGEMESKLKEFTDYIEGGGKSVQKELVKLLKGINKIDEKYHYIESMEAEDLFTYLSKILQSLKKTRLIETIEALREW